MSTSTVNGISPLDGFVGGRFLIWRRQVISYWLRKSKSTYDLLIRLEFPKAVASPAQSSIAAATAVGSDDAPENPGAQPTATAADTVPRTRPRSQRVRAENLPVAVPLEQGRQALADAAAEDEIDWAAAGDILMFLGPTLASRYVRVASGREIWLSLQREYEEHCMNYASVVELQFRNLGPRTLETVQEYADRAWALSVELEELGRTVAFPSLQEAMLAGLQRERPTWATVIQGVIAILPMHQENWKHDGGLRCWQRVMSSLVQAEVRQAELAPAAIAFAAQAAPAARNVQDEQIAALTAQVEELRAGAGRAQGRGRGGGGNRRGGRVTAGRGANDESRLADYQVGTKHCLVCGSTDHVAQACPGNWYQRGASGHPSCSLASPGEAVPFAWVMDTGATQHMSPGGGGVFRSYRLLQPPVRVRFAGQGVWAPAVGVGDVQIMGVHGPFLLQEVLHVPALAGPLLSISAEVSRGAAFHIHPPHSRAGPHRATLLDPATGRVVLSASFAGGLYVVDSQPCALSATAGISPLDEAWLWHRRLGHIRFEALGDLAKAGRLPGCTLTASQFLQAGRAAVCEPCVVAKLRRAPHHPRPPRVLEVCDTLSSDLCSFPIPAAGYGHARHFHSLVDHATGYARLTFLPRKSDVARAQREGIAWYETQTDRKVRRVLNDRGGEYVSTELRAWYAARGTQPLLTAAYTPESNGIAERFNLRVLDLVTAMLSDSPLGDEHYADAAHYAVDLLNAGVFSGAACSPHEALLGRRLELDAFRRFGCRCWVHVPGAPHKHRLKLSPRALPGHFLGFQQPLGSGIYRVVLDDGRLTQSRTVRFCEGSLLLPVGGGEDDNGEPQLAPPVPQPVPPCGPPAPPAPVPPPPVPPPVPPRGPPPTPAPVLPEVQQDPLSGEVAQQNPLPLAAPVNVFLSQMHTSKPTRT